VSRWGNIVEFGVTSAANVRPLLERAAWSELAAFDLRFRSELRWTPWYDLGPADVASFAAEPEHAPLVRLASLHPNGFVREAAVRALGASSDNGDIPFLLLRANDWVTVIADAAFAGARARITTVLAREWVSALPLVERLGASSRRDHQPLVSEVDRMLATPDARDALAEGLLRGERTVRRACLRVAERIGGNDARILLRLATKDHDPFIAARAMKALPDHTSDEDLPALLAEMAKSPFPDVRARALSMRCDRAPDAASAWLEAALFDRSSEVRELARWKMQDVERARDLYRGAMKTARGHALDVAFRGLAEIGTIDDVATFRAHLEDPRARIRESALLGIGRTDVDRHHDEIMRATKDPSSRVRKMARGFARLFMGRRYPLI
jgi:HEAT repeat protein